MNPRRPMDTVFALVDAALRLPADRRVGWVSDQLTDGLARREALAMLAAVSQGHSPADGGVRLSLERAVIGDFEVVRPLGCGAGGIVYEAVQRMPRRRVALKVLRAAREAAATQLENESQALARVSHPGIAAVHAAGIAELEGLLVPWIAMELVDGARTATARAEELRGNRDAVAALLADFAEAIAAAHRSGVLHRDIKPANLLVDGDGNAKVVDFGIAVRIGGGSEPAGTPSFMAPECRDGGTATCRSDVWSLGAVAERMFDAARLDRSDRLRLVSGKATAPEPTARHGDAGHFAKDLRRVIAGHPADGERTSRLRRAWMAAARHPVASAAAAIASVALLSAATWSAWMRLSAEARGIRDAQRMLALHGEVTASIDRLSAEERPKAVTDAIERARLAFGGPFPDPEIAFLSMASLLRLGEPEEACRLAGEAHAALASNPQVASDDIRWIEVTWHACEARGNEGPAMERLVDSLAAVGRRSSGDDLLLAWYLHAVTVENRDARFGELALAVDGGFNRDPSGATWRTMLAFVGLSLRGDRAADPAGMELLARGMRRSFDPASRTALAVTYANLCVAGMLAAVRGGDGDWFESMVQLGREAAAAADNPTFRVWTELSIANGLLGLGRYEHASSVLDAVARSDDLAPCDETTLVFWLPNRVQAGLRRESPHEQLVSVARIVADRPKLASGDRLLAEFLEALELGEQGRCRELLARWQERQLKRAPGTLRDERMRLGGEIEAFLDAAGAR